jgi:adenine deaminase
MVKSVLENLDYSPFMEIALCTDDVEPTGIISEGMMDGVLREVIANGIPQAVAYRWATLNGARHYHLKDLGAIAPGRIADILLLTSLEDVRVCDVFTNGKMVAKDGILTAKISEPPVTIDTRNSMNFHSRPTRETFMIKAPIENGTVNVNAIEMCDSNLTVKRKISVPVENHYMKPERVSNDLCYLTVVPRHGQAHPPITVLLSGLHLLRGTLGSTVAHDSHTC